MSVCKRAARRFLSVAVLATTLFAAAITSQVGVVTAEATRLRAEPNFNAPILALITVETDFSTGDSEMDFWFQLLFRDQEEFVSGFYVDENNTLLAYVNTTGSIDLNLRSGPGTAYSIVDQVSSGNLLTVVSVTDGWYAVEYEEDISFVSSEYVILMTQDEYDEYKESASYMGSQLVDIAINYLGCKYVYGGNGPSTFDCSGFTSYIYAQLGYSINRTASDQMKNGYTVERYELEPGDLVFFRAAGTVKAASHVGIYVGDGQFIHASTNNYVVRYDSLDSTYYSNIYVGARRVI